MEVEWKEQKFHLNKERKMFGLTTKLSREEVATINAAAQASPHLSDTVVAVAVMPDPGITAPAPRKAGPSKLADLSEYATVAASVGIAVPELAIESFVAFMEKHDLPIYDLAEVVAYMDDKAKREGLGYGWEWLAVRLKDRFPGQFGRACSRGDMWGQRADTVTPASDYYAPATQWGDRPAYSKTIPMHALKRIALIEKEHDRPVHFMVCDYSTQEHVRPDPFLMAVVPNPKVGEGIGRFVIDFWDEPGFGIEQMLK